MNHSGITARLLDLASVLAGRLKGGLAQVSILLATLMGGVSGSCIADAAMQTRMLGPEMLKRGFSPGYAAGVLSFGSLIDADHPAGDRLHPLRHRRPGLDRAPLRRRLRAGVPAVGRARVHDLGHRAPARLRARAQDAPDGGRGGARARGRHLGDPLPGDPAGGPALRRLHALGDRRVRGRLRGPGRNGRLPQADRRRVPRGARGQPRRRRRGDVPARACRASSATASSSSACRR